MMLPPKVTLPASTTLYIMAGKESGIERKILEPIEKKHFDENKQMNRQIDANMEPALTSYTESEGQPGVGSPGSLAVAQSQDIRLRGSLS